jgi:putative DNA methylase
MFGDEVVTRGNLPHWYVPGTAHFVTYRLADTIPVALLREWRQRRESHSQQMPLLGVSPAEHRMRVHKQFFASYDRYLDNHTQRDWLANAKVAGVIRDNLHHHNGTKYELLAYSILPNHVHVLFQPFEHVDEAASFVNRIHGASEPKKTSAEAGSFAYEDALSDEIADSRSPLSSIMHSLKSYTANRANEVLGRRGQFWQHESYDHWVRDLEELERIVNYIRRNPVEAGLCGVPHEWQFSSAFDRYRQDRSECGLVGRLRDDWRRSQP